MYKKELYDKDEEIKRIKEIDDIRAKGEMTELEKWYKNTFNKADEKENAYEIWLKIDGEAFAYYLFPYDAGVIECE